MNEQKLYHYYNYILFIIEDRDYLFKVLLFIQK